MATPVGLEIADMGQTELYGDHAGRGAGFNRAPLLLPIQYCAWKRHRHIRTNANVTY